MSDQVFFHEAHGLALSAREAARALRISARTLWSHTRRNEIPHVRVGRRILYPIDELRAWIRRMVEQGGGAAPAIDS